MGNLCTGQTNEIPQQINLQSFNTELYLKCSSLSIRMGEVEKLNSTNIYQPNRFLFILPIKQTEQFCKIQCTVISSYSDHLSLNVPILNGIETVRLNARSSPIIDLHELDNDRQIMHKFTIMRQRNCDRFYTVKVYPFSNNHHDVFKNGLYQAYLYRCIESYTRTSIMKDFFILQKGRPASLVFIFGSFLSSLEDILIYRRQYSIAYTKDQQIFICDQILNRYTVLLENNIVHRDIRPSKIYLADSLQESKGEAVSILGYQLLNLQSARKLSPKEMRMQECQDDGRMLMSVRGVPMYSEGDVLSYHLQKQEAGIYNPWHNDRIQLAKTFAMIVTLQINIQQIHYDEVKRRNKEIYNLIKELQNFSIPIRSIIRNFHESYDDKLQLIIGIVRSDYNICKTNLSKLIQINNKQRIEKSTIQILYTLHQQQLIKQKIGKTIINNFQDNHSYNNVSVFNRMGQYYQGMGISNNEYYKDQIHLLVQLSLKAREMCRPNNELMDEAKKLYADKFFGKVNDPVININYKVENAYLAVKNEDITYANELINDAFFQGASSKIPIETQLKLLQGKGVIQTIRNGADAGNLYFQKGLDLSRNDKNFTVESTQMRAISNFEYLLGKNYLMKINVNKDIISQNEQLEELKKCQLLLNSSKQKRVYIQNKYPVRLAHIYQILGDICLLKEDHKGTRNNYQQVNNIYIKSTMEIGKYQQIRILEKLYKYYHQYSQNYKEQEKVKSMILNLKKRSEIKDNIDHKKIFKRMRELKQDKKHKIFNKKNRNSIINQVDQILEESVSIQRQSASQHSNYLGQQKLSVVDASNHLQIMQKQIV